MNVSEIKNVELFFNNNFNKIYLLNSIGFINSDYDKVLLESPLINELFNINETFIFRTNQKNTIVYYELYTEKLFIITINSFIINAFILLPNVILILTEFDKYYLNIKNFKYDKLLKITEDSSLETFIINNCESIESSSFPNIATKSELDCIQLDPLDFQKINGKPLHTNRISSLSRFIICRCENNQIVYYLTFQNETTNFTLNELIAFLNNKFYYLLHSIIYIKNEENVH